MRKLTIAALAGLTIAGGLGLATSGSAQPYRYYSPYDHSWHYTYDRDRYERYRYRYHDRDDDDAGAALAGAVLGSLLGSDTGYYDRAPVDRFGPNPAGMIAPDGHRIRCRLRTNWDSYRDAYVTRRACW